MFERDDGGLVRVWDVEEDVVYRGGEANGQEEGRRRVDRLGCWSRCRCAIVDTAVVGWRHCERRKALVVRSVGRRRGGPVGAPASAHLVGDGLACRVSNTIFCVWACAGDCEIVCFGGMERNSSMIAACRVATSRLATVESSHVPVGRAFAHDVSVGDRRGPR